MERWQLPAIATRQWVSPMPKQSGNLHKGDESPSANHTEQSSVGGCEAGAVRVVRFRMCHRLPCSFYFPYLCGHLPFISPQTKETAKWHLEIMAST